ncbi:MAG: imidazoleglycerol-phosphate dehydratase HisB [Aigarchaeota archaeon]|nr:imidazoleglycerol-phosphate dehydratase HisB [Aigarchaeota archaeon]MDW8021598.1 imidazoleglycerol-phosphate dehydratase HisB [Nitrososphaerota archaeon]
MREAEYLRKTAETEVKVRVRLEGSGSASVNTGVSFLDHMLRSLATHSLMDLSVEARGDLRHHVIEDVAICLGEALRRALGDAAGIRRFGYAIVPMDCSLAFAAIDLSNRPYPKIDLKLEGESIEDMRCEDIYHFLETLTNSLKANIHIWTQYGSNDHHKVEAAFKALALSLRQAVSIDVERSGIPSSKGVL